MFTRAVITDEISQDLDRAARMARQYGLDQLEIRTAWDVRVDNMTAEQWAEVKRIADRYGLGIVCIASPFLKCDIDSPEEYQQHLAILRHAIRAAHALGARIIRTFTFWKKGQLAQRCDEIVARYREPARIAAQEGVVLGVENEGACFVTNGAELARFLSTLNEPSVRAVWDPGNACWGGQERAYPDGYALVQPYIVHVHLKDVVRQNGEPEATVLGEGEVNILGQLQALARDGYTGCASLETHYRIRPLTERARNLPGGSAFSEGGEEASELCLRNWNRMMEQVRAGR